MLAAVAGRCYTRGEGLSRGEAGTSVCRFGSDVTSATAYGFRRPAHRKHVWGYFVGPGRWCSGIFGTVGFGERRRAGWAVRTGARFGAGYRGEGNCQSAGSDFVGGDDAAAFVSVGSGGRVRGEGGFGGALAGRTDGGFCGEGACGDLYDADGEQSR